MADSDEIKIRTLPRGSEGSEKDKENADTNAKKSRWIIYVATASCLLLVLTLTAHGPKRHLSRRPIKGQTVLASTKPALEDAVTRHLQDSQIKYDMMVHTREMENLQFKDAASEPKSEDIVTLPDNRSYGVQMDSENSAERVYEDLNDEPAGYSDTLPIDKINARLAKRKWVNEQERAENIAYIGDFIRSAYDRGYELDINQDLVVVGVHHIDINRKLNINQVMDRLAKQGL